jgi:hypothetical protein
VPSRRRRPPRGRAGRLRWSARYAALQQPEAHRPPSSALRRRRLLEAGHASDDVSRRARSIKMPLPSSTLSDRFQGEQIRRPGAAPAILAARSPASRAASAPSAAARPGSIHIVGRHGGERQEPADVGVRDALLLRNVGDRLRLPALNPAPPAMRADERLDQRLVAARLRRQRG